MRNDAEFLLLSGPGSTNVKNYCTVVNSSTGKSCKESKRAEFAQNLNLAVKAANKKGLSEAARELAEKRKTVAALEKDIVKLEKQVATEPMNSMAVKTALEKCAAAGALAAAGELEMIKRTKNVSVTGVKVACLVYQRPIGRMSIRPTNT